MSKFSFTTAPLEALDSRGNVMTSGTAFFYKRLGKLGYLVTNWHMVTDRSPLRPSHHKTGVVPTHLRLRLHKNVGAESISLTQKVDWTFPINDEHGEAPVWLEHPIYAYRCDVVAITFNQLELSRIATFAWLAEEDLQPALPVDPMSDVFVIGYPWGHSSGDGVLPIYKRGSVASDVRVAPDGLPRFMIDCRTVSGMSGSPVLVSNSGYFTPTGQPQDAIFGTIHDFAGVYSGRHEARTSSTRELEAVTDLGIVWTKPAVEMIVNSGAPGTSLGKVLAE